MIGHRPSPTTSKYQRHGSSFHGSPVEASTRSDERSCATHGFVAVRHQRADERGRHAEHVDAMALDERPEPIGLGIVGRAVVEHERAAVGERADDLPRPHDPADVGEPEQALARRAGPSGTRPLRRSSRGSRRARAPRPSAGRSCRSCTRRTADARSRPLPRRTGRADRAPGRRASRHGRASSEDRRAPGGARPRPCGRCRPGRPPRRPSPSSAPSCPAG